MATTTTTKSRLSPAQHAARKASAAQSKGPITDGGKARAALNSLVHGLCSLAPTLPGEDPTIFEQMFSKWVKEQQPKDENERRLVYNMVCATVAADRVRRADAAALAIRMRKAGEDWDGERAKSLGETTYLVGRGRHDLVTPLLARADGVRWLIGQWERLDGRLAEGKTIDATERTLALTMLGCVYADLDDERAREVHALGMALEVAAGLKPEEHAKYAKKGIAADNDRPRERLRAIIAAEWEALTSLLPDLEAAEAAERQLAVDAATIDTSEEGAKRHRYLQDHLRTIRQLSAALAASKASRLKLYDPLTMPSREWTPPADPPTLDLDLDLGPIRNEPKIEPRYDRKAIYDKIAAIPKRPAAADFVIGQAPTPTTAPPPPR